jgi:cell division protein FtsB
MDWDDPTHTSLPKSARRSPERRDVEEHQLTEVKQPSRLPWLLVASVLAALVLSSAWWWLHLNEKVAQIAALKEELSDVRTMSSGAESQLEELKANNIELAAKVTQLTQEKSLLEAREKSRNGLAPAAEKQAVRPVAPVFKKAPPPPPKKTRRR